MKSPALTIILLPALIGALAYQHTRQITHPRTDSNRGDLRDALKNQTLEEINLEKLHLNSVSAHNVSGRPIGDSRQTEPGSSQNLTSLGDWAGCEDPDRDYFPIASENGELKPRCRPDTLYIWAGPRREQILLKNVLHAEIADRFTIYTHVNPVATFAYGEMQIRIKLKKDVKFLLLDPWPGCDGSNGRRLPDEQTKTTVFIRYFKFNESKEFDPTDWGGVDYILCSAGPIHSLSIGTRQAYNEMTAALEWIEKQPPVPSSPMPELPANKIHYEPTYNWLPYLKYRGYSSFYHSFPVDSHDWSPTSLRIKINQSRHLYEQNLDRIYYAEDVIPNESAHFASSHKTYWNLK